MTEQIERVLEKGKLESSKILLAEYYAKQDKAQWMADRQAEYEVIYPAYRDMTDEEKAEHDLQFTEENPKPVTFDEDNNELEYVYPQVEIDYSEDESYVTFTEWLNEQVLVSEEVPAVVETDAEGFEVVVTPLVPAVYEQVRPYVAKDTTDRVEAYLDPHYKQVKIDEAQAYLDSTDMYMTIDKYAQLDDATKADLETKREEARVVIRTLRDGE